MGTNVLRQSKTSRSKLHASRLLAWVLCPAALVAFACEQQPSKIELPPLPARTSDAGKPAFPCQDETSHGCQGEVFVHCERHGEFLEAIELDCGALGQVCDAEQKCVVCRPGVRRCRDCTGQDSDCNPDVVEACDDAGKMFVEQRTCGLNAPEVCSQGDCVNACELARTQNSYAGCEFYAVDLDNAALDVTDNAAAQQYAVVVANPQRVPVDVWVERNNAAYGDAPATQELDRKRVPPGDLEVFKLPQREVDGSSPGGINDGTHSALSSNAYHVLSNYPITAYQFNPLENVNVFSNGASLLLPTAALGSEYTVVGWPQTIGNSDNPDQDFDHTSSDEDLRAFVSVVGVQSGTQVSVDLGAHLPQIAGAPGIPAGKSGDTLSFQLGPFDVLNLETMGLNGDFTGTRIRSSSPVALFVGSEASDVPTFKTYATRQCCADHLEEQLLPDRSAGSQFIVGHMPSRTHALNNAALPGAPLGVAEVIEPEWIHIVAASPGMTRVQTTLDGADAEFTLAEREDAIVRADRDFAIQADKPIHVLEAIASQGVTGIPRQFPGGDPSIIAVPPVEQFRRDYIFLTPDKYAFDFVTVVSPVDAKIQLDGAPLPETCDSKPADGVPRGVNDPAPEWVVHRCQLSFPEISNADRLGGLQGSASPDIVRVLPGNQNDGPHTVVSDKPVSIVVYGFDRFVSYAYVGGLNLISLN